MMVISRKINSKRGGFTLVELIVVLVIIGILLALVIPALTGYIDKAQATACRKNRAELEKLYRYDTLLATADGKTVTDIMDDVLKSSNGKKLACPSGGTYTYNSNTERLTCSISKHNAGTVGTNPIAAGVLEKMPADLKNQQMDSGAVEGNYTPDFLAALTAAGLNFSDMNIASWSYHPNDSLFWTAVDISKLAVGNVVPAMKYNIKTGVYSVWQLKITTGTFNNNVITYNILPAGGTEVDASKMITATAEEKKNYDTLNAIYQAALNEYNKTP